MTERASPDAAAKAASVGRRLGALGYELLLLAALWLVAGFLLTPIVSPSASSSAGRLVVPTHAASAVSFVALFVITGAYYVACWTGGRRTLPQKTWRLSIVDAAGRPLTPRRALARYVAAWIGPAIAVALYALLAPHGLGAHAAWFVALGWLWPIVDRDRLFLHDRVAGTRIVGDRR